MQELWVMGLAVWCLAILGVIVTDYLWPWGTKPRNRNGSKYLKRGR